MLFSILIWHIVAASSSTLVHVRFDGARLKITIGLCVFPSIIAAELLDWPSVSADPLLQLCRDISAIA